MSTHYSRSVIFTSCGVTVLLKAIESIKVETASEQAVVDALKDDFCLNIVTTSGKEYRVSIANIRNEYNIHDTHSSADIGQAIVDKWLRIHQ